MRYGEDDYGNNGGDPFFGDFAVYGANPEASAYRMPTAANLAVTPQAAPTAIQSQPSWGTGGLGSYQLSDPSLAATPEWLQSRDPSLNRIDWGGNYDPVTGRLGVLPFFVGGSEAQDASYFQDGDTSNMAGYAGVLETGLPTYNISTEFGRPVDNYLKLNPDSANPVRIINASEGKITYEGAADPQGLVSALDQATAEGNKDIWSVQEKIGDQWVTTHKNEPIGNLVRDVALPAMLAVAGGAALGPLIGGTQGTLLGAGKLAAAAGTGLGSAAGSFTGNVAAGKSVEDALKAAAISGVTAGVLKGVMPGGSPGGMGPMPDIDYAGLNSAVFGGGAALPSAALEPMLTAAAGKLAGAALPSVFGGAASGLAGSAPGSSTPDEGMLEALGTRAPPPAPSIPGGIANIVGAAEPLGRMPETIEEEATVTGKRYDDPSLGASLSVPANVAPPLLETTLSDIMQQYEAPPTEEAMQTVEQARPEQPTPPPIFVPPSAPLLETTLSDIMQQYEAPPTEEAMQTVEQARPEQPTPPPIFVPPLESLPVFDVANVVGPDEALGRMPETVEEEATVTGKRYDDPSLGASLAVPVSPPVVDAGYSVFPGDEPMLESSPDRLQREDFSSPLVVPPVSPLPNFEAPFTGVDTAVPGEDPEQVVTGTKVPPATFPPTTLAFPDAPFTVPPTTIPPFEAPPTVEEPKKGSTLQKVLGGLTLLDLLSGAVGGGGGNTATGGAGKLNPIFSAKLPGATSTLTQQSLAPRPGGVSGPAMSDIDWYRYGYNPERSFFNYVPADEDGRRAMIAPPQPDTQLARGGALAVKKGGAPAKESFAVKGPGTGRSDEIPALLSDGEYVIDAETVALLGDGSSEAGAKRLDDFRVSIRKHKGSNLARGKFSANAKRPEKYLSGGRT